MVVTLLLLSIIVDIIISQTALEIQIGNGESCTGKSGSIQQQPNKQIAYDLRNLYDPNGFLVGERGIYSNKSLRMSICGHMTPNQTSCGQPDSKWCFEEVNKDESCIVGIANWEQNSETGSLIEYAAMFRTTEVNEESIFGVRVSVLDYGQYGNISCLNKHSIVNYFILCAPDTNWTHMSFSQNRSECDWNVTLRSQYGCFDIIHYNDSSSTFTNLSAGSVFLIIFIVILLTYCILGCAYNSFYHGRVGMDAIPNKQKWSNLGRYSQSGCEVTRDTLCCSKTSGSYQEL
eukprot:491089_1